jgi:hypothetical protein
MNSFRLVDEEPGLRPPQNKKIWWSSLSETQARTIPARSESPTDLF